MLNKFLVSVAAGSFIVFIGGCASLDVEESTLALQKEVPEKLFIDDFNAGVKPNMLGGDFGAWDKDPADKTQYCKESFDSEIKVGSEGFSIKLEYDVDSPNPAYNGFWMKLENADFRPYEKICFSVKGDEKTKFTDKFKIELKNAKGEIGRVLVTDVTEEWQEKVILFRDFRGIFDFSKMTEFVIVFDDVTSNPKTGIIWIDDIYVTK
ncbi:MAG: carbohydrate binding domain-containing protein [Elusimicrobiota bacterium]|nr:carbohydrate binding domain-containing protein [Elusimicrobiota bacterium]